MTLGVVAIGRNEGPRLHRCLASATTGVADAAVYVDSNSTDGSTDLARSLGVEVVLLDMTVPFTAARARNAGFARLRERLPDMRFVQFVDADCELVDGWMQRARQALDESPDAAAVCGRRRERRPQASIYNALCDIEWDTPVGEAAACGGDAMMRVEAFEQMRGFDDTLIAGEEPELCVRLRRAGWKVLRIDREMTLHDAAITRFGQWWKRSVRAGHAYAQGAWMHGASPQRHCVRPVVSILVWTILLPVVIVTAAVLTGGWGLLLAAMYPLQGWRIARRKRRDGCDARLSRRFAFFILMGKFAEGCGMARFLASRLVGRRTRLIEYKGAPVEGARN